MRACARLLLLPLLACSLLPTTARADDSAQAHARVALVIGNAGYTAVKPLINPTNDAHDMCEVLGQLGYRVACFQDIADRGEFKARIQDFVDSLSPKADVLFYYAGHAVQLKGENYLIPINARLRAESDIPRETISLTYLMTQLAQGRHHLNIVILDACRNNPWPDSLRDRAAGLAPITAIPRGTMVLYATAADDVSGDGTERNGVLTKNLLANIRTPGLTVDDVFKRVSEGVQADSLAAVGHAQTPALYTNFTGEFCFAGCIDKVARAELEKMQQASQAQLERMQHENAEMQAKLAATETSMNCDKSVLSQSSQCFKAPPEPTARAVTAALLQAGFEIGETDVSAGIVTAVRKLANSTDKNSTDTLNVRTTIRAVPITGHSVVSITADQQTTHVQVSHKWTQMVVIPVPTQTQYQTVLDKDTNVADPAFYADLFAAIERNLRVAAPDLQTTGRPPSPGESSSGSEVAEKASAEQTPPPPPALAAAAGARESTPAQAGTAQMFPVGIDRAMTATVQAIVQSGYVIDSIDHSLGLLRASRSLADPKDARYSNNFTLTAYVMADSAGSSRVQLSANQQRVLHRKSDRVFGKPTYQPAVVEHDSSIRDNAFYGGLFHAIELDLSGPGSAALGHSHRFGASADRTLPALLDGLAQRGFTVERADGVVGFTTVQRSNENAKDQETTTDRATVYVSPAGGGDSIVTVAAGQRVTTSGLQDFGISRNPLGMGLFGMSSSRMAAALQASLMDPQSVVVREGEISDARFYDELFNVVAEKLSH